MIKKSIFLSVILNFCFSQTTFFGLDGWYSINSIATAGGAGAVSNTDSDILNPAGLATLKEQVQFNIIKYPANISAQSAMYVKQLSNTNLGLALRHLSYGEFISADEDGVENGTYSANDTWLSVGMSKAKENVSLGVTGGVFISNLGSYRAAAIVFSSGMIYDYSKNNIQVGISLSNFGVFFARYAEHREKLPTKIILSINKGLMHLPLDLNADVEYSTPNKTTHWRFGGIFELPYNLQLSAGINSNNFAQRTDSNLAKSLLGSSGIGIAYMNNKYSIELGGYSYGIGGWIYGTGFNIKL